MKYGFERGTDCKFLEEIPKGSSSEYLSHLSRLGRRDEGKARSAEDLPVLRLF